MNLRRDFTDLYTNYYQKKNLTFFSFLLIFFNIGPSTAYRIIRACGIPTNLHIKNVSKSVDINSLYFIVKEQFYYPHIELKAFRLKRLKLLETYTCSRYNKNLPIRGQRTKTNARTRKKFKIL